MCGRYASTRSSVDLSSLFDADDDTDGALEPDYDIAPTDPVPIVRRAGTQNAVSIARWGLVPSWMGREAAARTQYKLINARAETVATSRSYAVAFAGQRCLVPADGWYEWRKWPGGRLIAADRGRGKQAYYMTSRDGGVLAFAGLFSPWRHDGTDRLTCAIVTTPAIGELAGVHDRMPLLLPKERWAAWLGCAEEPADRTGLLRPTPEEYAAAIEIRPVGPAVGDVRNDGPDLIRAVAVAEPDSSTVDSQDLTLF